MTKQITELWKSLFRKEIVPPNEVDEEEEEITEEVIRPPVIRVLTKKKSIKDE